MVKSIIQRQMKNAFFLIFILTTISFDLYCIDFVRHPSTGIKVRFANNSKMFPESWIGGEINAQSTQLKIGELKRSIDIVFNALDKYPATFLRENLKEVYILHEISFYGVEYGGTNSNDVVYITNQGLEEGYTEQYIEQLFHAEFSSIILRNYAPLDFEPRWCRINSPDFIYGDGGVTEIKIGKAGLDYSEYYFEQGFLYEYALSGSENDLNSIAKNLFCPVYEFWSVYTKYQKLTKKINLTIELYNSANSAFSLEYFRKLNQ